MNNTFTIGSVTLRYAREYFNEAYQNERSLEVALGRWFLDRHPEVIVENPRYAAMEQKPVIEVGCVLPYYSSHTIHEVIDLADDHPASRKVNALSLDYTGRNLLSISTIEHMQSAEYGNKSDEDSITFLQQVVSQASNYLITWGVGYNPVLDEWVKTHSEIPRTFMERTSWKNEYTQRAEGPEIWQIPFGHSDRPIPQGRFNNANCVVIVTNVKELLEETK